MPLLPQVCTAALPEHCVAPGAQVPVHTPFEHAALPHATGAPQAPLALHVSTPSPLPPSAVVEQRTDPGEHDPVQAPPTHAEFEQVAGVPHVPVALHVETPLTEPPSDPTAHSVAPGAHTPWHAAAPTAPTHAWFVQDAAVPHVPAAVHVWMAAFPEHCVWPGEQTPLQEAVPPATRHVLSVQAAGVPHVPVAEQVERALIEPPSLPVAHSVVPGAHTPAHSPSPLTVTHA